MVKINQTIENFSEPEEKETYKIVSVKETDVTGLKGLSVLFEPTEPTPDTEKIEYKATLWYAKKIEYKATLWYGQSKTTTSKSKLGAFLEAFKEYFEREEIEGEFSDTDAWIGHTVKIITWKNKDRKVSIIA